MYFLMTYYKYNVYLIAIHINVIFLCNFTESPLIDKQFQILHIYEIQTKFIKY